MNTRYSVWMDGKGLQDIDPTIYITDIKEKQPKQNMVTASQGLRGGTRLLCVVRESLSVVVRYAIREYDTYRRRDICSRIRAWAHDGYLSTSDRPGQRLWVVCEKLPNVDSALKWTGEMELTFTAYACPWWEAQTAKKAELTGSSGKADLIAMGDMESLLDAYVTAHGAVNTVTIAVNGRKFAFAGLGMAAGQELTVSHNQDGLLFICKDGVSILGKRTADSADELILLPQKSNEITFTADAPCTAVFTSRGRYV